MSLEIFAELPEELKIYILQLYTRSLRKRFLQTALTFPHWNKNQDSSEKHGLGFASFHTSRSHKWKVRIGYFPHMEFRQTTHYFQETPLFVQDSTRWYQERENWQNINYPIRPRSG